MKRSASLRLDEESCQHINLRRQRQPRLSRFSGLRAQDTLPDVLVVPQVLQLIRRPHCCLGVGLCHEGVANADHTVVLQLPDLRNTHNIRIRH